MVNLVSILLIYSFLAGKYNRGFLTLVKMDRKIVTAKRKGAVITDADVNNDDGDDEGENDSPTEYDDATNLGEMQARQTKKTKNN